MEKVLKTVKMVFHGCCTIEENNLLRGIVKEPFKNFGNAINALFIQTVMPKPE
jgi:hypothetical protein